METKIRNGNLIVVLPLEEPKLLATGKTLVVASSRGVRRTTCRLEGEIVCVIANAFVYPSEREKGREQRKKQKQSVDLSKHSRSRKKRGALRTRQDRT
jgi:hypothetical protein